MNIIYKKIEIRKLYIVFLLFIPLNLLSQKIQVGKVYGFNSTIIKDHSSQTKINETNKVEIKNNYKIKVLKYDSARNVVAFRYLYFTDTTTTSAKELNHKVFEMPYNEFNQFTNIIYPKFKGVQVGAYIIPFRLRVDGSNFDFESSLSLQTNLIFGFGSIYKERSVLDFSAGIGLSSINLDTINSLSAEVRTASAFTVSLGLVWKPAKNANVGLFIGSDFLGAKDRSVNWIYDKKLWIGLGINISFNKIISEGETGGKNK